MPDAKLNALSKALINRVFRELGINCDSSHLDFLSQVFEDCGFAFPASVEFTSEFNADELRNSLYSAPPMPIIEPLSTIIGLALASSLRVNTEFYSDLWPRLTDALAQLRALGIDVAVHSSVFDVNRVFVFDEVVRRLIRLPRIDELRDTTEFGSKIEVIGLSRRFIEAPVRQFSIAEPTEARLGNDVVNAVEVLTKDLGGVATLKALSELVGHEAVLKALSMGGYVVYNPPSDMTIRATTKALTLIRRLSVNNDALGKEAKRGFSEPS
ncbi:hypothetical protein [Vulcanisaeta distributa]|uniref:hypothetical protein n=1 Tax=Vulcanisaeta distributa TaxID=164451 RepID=UPI000AF0CEB7|nr:hypothetical protein [Vulcanisaeta distributa]